MQEIFRVVTDHERRRDVDGQRHEVRQNGFEIVDAAGHAVIAHEGVCEDEDPGLVRGIRE